MAKVKAKKAANKAPPKKALPNKAVIKARKTLDSKQSPRNFKTLAEVRREIDRLDDVIVPLICQRYHAVTQAAQFKPSVKGVVVKSRVEEIVSRVRRMAKSFSANPDAIETVYRSMINVYTKDEQRNWRKIHKR